MKRFLLALLVALSLSSGPTLSVRGADAIIHADTPGQTLYVRIRTALTTSVAAALTEGTGNGVGYYVVTDATLVTAGLTGTAAYPYKVFVGAPSTSAADSQVGVGSLRWAATVAVDPLPNVAPGGSGGLAIVGSAMTLTAAGVDLVWDEIVAGITTARVALANASASATPETRDLAPTQHVWQLKRSGDGTLRATNTLYMHASDADIRVGWNCAIPAILPPGMVLSEMSLPTSSDSTAGVNVDAELGIDPTQAKVALSADSDAVAGDYWITTTVTNDKGGGPITIYGKVTVQAAP